MRLISLQAVHVPIYTLVANIPGSPSPMTMCCAAAHPLADVLGAASGGYGA